MQEADPASTPWVVDIKCNAVQWTSGAVFEFKRQWSAHLLAILLQHAQRNRPVTALQLQNHLQASGHKTSLNRAQHLRILEEVKSFSQSPLHGSETISVTHAPRKASVGPWRLKFLRGIDWRISADHADSDTPQQTWRWPRLLSAEITSVSPLLVCLGQWLTVEGLAVYSNIKPALDSVAELKGEPLSIEARAILSLREMQLLRQLGSWAQAMAVAEQVLTEPIPHLEHRAHSYARFMRQRIQYDKHPATAWMELLGNSQPPEPLLMPCPFTLADWHNMQGLMLRRAVLENTDSPDSPASTLHLRALLHIESAIYQALSFQHWDKLHAYLDNLAYYLQKVEPLGLCSVENVHDAYALALTCADKLDSGHDDATDLIFYAEFWLDRASKLTTPTQHRSAFFDDNLHPKHVIYWQHMLDRTRSINAPVQHGMALALSIRWAGACSVKLPAAWLATLKSELIQVLKDNEGLSERLAEDGYGQWLPG